MSGDKLYRNLPSLIDISSQVSTQRYAFPPREQEIVIVIGILVLVLEKRDK